MFQEIPRRDQQQDQQVGEPPRNFVAVNVEDIRGNGFGGILNVNEMYEDNRMERNIGNRDDVN